MDTCRNARRCKCSGRGDKDSTGWFRRKCRRVAGIRRRTLVPEHDGTMSLPRRWYGLSLGERKGGTALRHGPGLGAEEADRGMRDVFGLWISETEGARFWLDILTELRSKEHRHSTSFSFVGKEKRPQDSWYTTRTPQPWLTYSV